MWNSGCLKSRPCAGSVGIPTPKHKSAVGRPREVSNSGSLKGQPGARSVELPHLNPNVLWKNRAKYGTTIWLKRAIRNEETIARIVHGSTGGRSRFDQQVLSAGLTVLPRASHLQQGGVYPRCAGVGLWGQELKTTAGFCQWWSAPNRVVYQPGSRGVPAGTPARVECQTGGASPVGETLLAFLLFSDLLAEGAGNGTSVSSDKDGGLHLTASLRWGKQKNPGSIWGRSGIYPGSIWGRSGIYPGSIWDRSGIYPGSIWVRSRMDRGPIWN